MSTSETPDEPEVINDVYNGNFDETLDETMDDLQHLDLPTMKDLQHLNLPGEDIIAELVYSAIYGITQLNLGADEKFSWISSPHNMFLPSENGYTSTPTSEDTAVGVSNLNDISYENVLASEVDMDQETTVDIHHGVYAHILYLESLVSDGDECKVDSKDDEDAH